MTPLSRRRQAMIRGLEGRRHGGWRNRGRKRTRRSSTLSASATPGSRSKLSSDSLWRTTRPPSSENRSGLHHSVFSFFSLFLSFRYFFTSFNTRSISWVSTLERSNFASCGVAINLRRCRGVYSSVFNAKWKKMVKIATHNDCQCYNWTEAALFCETLMLQTAH